MKLGICGFEMAGKSTVFDALTGPGGDAPRRGEKRLRVVPVPDPRLERLREDYEPKKFTPATVQFVDFPGFGGDKYFGELRECDALVCVVMGFQSPNVVARDGKVDFRRDLEALEAELVFADFALVEKLIEKAEKSSRHLSKAARDKASHLHVLQKLKPVFEEGRSALEADLSDEEREEIRGFALLSLKPRIMLVNVDDDADVEALGLPPLPEWASDERPTSVTVAIRAGLEAEVAQLSEEERGEFLRDFGIEEVISSRLLRLSYQFLNLHSFLTAGPKEVRAWTIRRGTNAVDAAGKIHTDIQRGFIRAEVCAWEDYEQYGSVKAAKEAKHVRLEPKTYIVKDGDVIEFRHGG